MASITTYNGRRTIQIVCGDGKRRSIRLGMVSQRVAESVRVRVELLAAAAGSATAPDSETARWAAALDDTLHARIARAGLLPPREHMTIAQYIDRYIERRADVKGTTATVYLRVRRYLLGFLDGARPLRSVQRADVEAWRVHLLTELRLADNTARRSIGIARQFFAAAKRDGLIRENPADGFVAAVRANKARWRFITPADIRAVIDAAPNAEWRLIIALARFGGLRIPSELGGLRWSDVDLARGRLRVHAPKTEHHDGGTREVPIFGEMRQYMEDAYELAEPGAAYIFPDRFRTHGSALNLRTTLQKIITLAGLEPWPRLWVNLRASRATELVQTHPAHVAAAWLGHSPMTAAGFYQQVRDSDYARATAPPENSAVQNPVQQRHASARNRAHGPTDEFENVGNCRSSRDRANACKSLLHKELGPAGLEPDAKPSVNPASRKTGGAESGAVDARTGRPRFADAVAAVLALPLSDGEKAEAVRRLLAADRGDA